MTCPAMAPHTRTALRADPRPEERKGEYLRRVEYLDGRVTEEKLSEVHGVEQSFKHYEIWKELSLSGRGRSKEQDIKKERSSPAIGAEQVPVVSVRTPDGVFLPLTRFLETQTGRHTGLPQRDLPSLNLIISVRNTGEIPEALRTIRVAQQTILKGREVTVERIFLVSGATPTDAQRVLLAEIVPTEELAELRKAVLAEKQLEAKPLARSEAHQSAQQEALKEIQSYEAQISDASRIRHVAQQPLALEAAIAITTPEARDNLDELRNGIGEPQKTVQGEIPLEEVEIQSLKNPLLEAEFNAPLLIRELAQSALQQHGPEMVELLQERYVERLISPELVPANIGDLLEPAFKDMLVLQTEQSTDSIDLSVATLPPPPSLKEADLQTEIGVIQPERMLSSTVREVDSAKTEKIKAFSRVIQEPEPTEERVAQRVRALHSMLEAELDSMVA